MPALGNVGAYTAREWGCKGKRLFSSFFYILYGDTEVACSEALRKEERFYLYKLEGELCSLSTKHKSLTTFNWGADIVVCTGLVHRAFLFSFLND